MFKLYDLDMNEIPLPEGVKPLDIFVGSIAKERQTEAIPGRNGIVDYGTNYTERSVELSLWIISSDSIDYRLLRNELYALFDEGNAFYIGESNVPSRVLKVAVDDSYIPERITQRHASVEISCRTLDSVFWESRYTTLELHDSGYSAIAEKYGLVDSIDDEKVGYRFEPENVFNPNLIPLNQNDWEEGSISSTNGDDTDLSGRIRTSDYIRVVKGQSYHLQDSSKYVSAVDSINIYQYDNGEYVGDSGWIKINRQGQTKFTALGNQLKISLTPMDGFRVNLSTIENGNAKMKLEKGNRFTGYNPPPEIFTVYNAGNVMIEPESMYLHIIANTVTTPGGFTITNKTTGDEFVFNAEVDGHSILLKGIDVRVSSIYNRFRDTNRRFISLAPGDNEFEVSGGTFNNIRFDFRYLYK